VVDGERGGMGQALSTPELQERVDLLLGPTGYAFSYGFSQFGEWFPSSEPDSPPSHPSPRATASRAFVPYKRHRRYRSAYSCVRCGRFERWRARADRHRRERGK
jgi:hypothetical protein